LSIICFDASVVVFGKDNSEKPGDEHLDATSHTLL
jgi:hypothetical protein